MNNKLKFGLLIAIVALLLAPDALAVSSYVTPLNSLYGPGLSCGTCHVDPNGGGQRNAYGTLFQNQANHNADPTTALKAIGSPMTSTPAQTLTPTPLSTTANGEGDHHRAHIGNRDHRRNHSGNSEHHNTRSGSRHD